MGTYVDTRTETPDQTCPYNSKHVIPYRKFTAHLLECAKNHQDSDRVTCPFHAKHRILREDMHDHLALCPFFETGVVSKEQMEEYARWAELKKQKVDQQADEPPEDWDKDQ